MLQQGDQQVCAKRQDTNISQVLCWLEMVHVLELQDLIAPACPARCQLSSKHLHNTTACDHHSTWSSEKQDGIQDDLICLTGWLFKTTSRVRKRI